jgi:hypothetical protein
MLTVPPTNARTIRQFSKLELWGSAISHGLRGRPVAKATLGLAESGWAEEVVKAIRNPRLVERMTINVQNKDFSD